MLDEEAFKKTVFDWEAQEGSAGRGRNFKTVFDWDSQLLQKAVLDEEAVAFKKTVFDWEVQLLQ